MAYPIGLGNIAIVYREKGDFNKSEKFQEESDKLKLEIFEIDLYG